MKTILLASVAVLAISASAGVATAKPQHPTVMGKMSASTRHVVLPSRAQTLYDQNSDSEGYADVSQMFESTFEQYDAQGADDFVVPSGEKWTITEVDVTGLYFNGSGPASAFNVFFYKDRNGKPGKLMGEVDDATYVDTGFGSPDINLGKGVKLKNGTYWVSVQADLAFEVGGEWGWGTRNTQVGTEAMWQNPEGGFGLGCTKWAPEAACLGGLAGPDHMFALKGKSRGG